VEKITTVCIKCGKTLATSKRRLEDAYFDSELRVRKMELLRQKGLTGKEDISYAWCCECYKEEKKKEGVNKMGRKDFVEVKAVYERDTKRYHRFNIESEEVTGVVYVKRDAELPREVRVKLTVEGDKE